MFLPLYSSGPPMAPIRKRETIALCFGSVSASKKCPISGSARSLVIFLIEFYLEMTMSFLRSRLSRREDALLALLASAPLAPKGWN